MHIVTGYGILAFHFLDRTAGGVDFDLTAAILAAQEVIVIGFQAGPADLGDVGYAFDAFQALGVFFIDLAYVAKDLGGHHLVRIIADRLDVDGDARQVVALFFDFRDDILGQVIGQDRRHVRALDLLDLFPQLIFRHIEDAGQFMQFFVAHAVLRRHVGHHEARPRADEDLSVAVVHDTAHGCNGDGPQAVPFGQGIIIFTGKELQVDQPADEDDENRDDDPVEVAETAILILLFQ